MCSCQVEGNLQTVEAHASEKDRSRREHGEQSLVSNSQFVRMSFLTFLTLKVCGGESLEDIP